MRLDIDMSTASPAKTSYTINHRLTAETERLEGGFLKLKFSGAINEDFDYASAMDLVISIMGKGSKAVVFDMGAVESLNSVGVRSWLLFIQHLQGLHPAFFYRLNELFVEQASIVPNLLGKRGTKVVMVDLPYICPQCNNRIIRVAKTKAIGFDGKKYALPEVSCETCKVPMEFDAVEKEYFNFLKYTDDHR